MNSDSKVDAYIRGLELWQAEIVMRLRSIVRQAAPQAAESFKWGQPVYEDHGPVCCMKAFKSGVNFGFWRGGDLEDPHHLLQGSGAKMRHVKIGGLQDVSADAFAHFIRQAVALNRIKGDPNSGE